MPEPSDSGPDLAGRPFAAGGFLKFIADTVSVFELNFLPALKLWYVTILLAAAFPLPWFYVTRAIAPDDPQVLRRLLTGTLVFGVAFSIGTIVGQTFVGQRFSGTLRLLITMPVSKGAYFLGSLAHASISGALTVPILLAFALVAGVDINLEWGLAPALLLTVLAVSGLTLFVVKGVLPHISIGTIFRAQIPFIIMDAAAMGILILFPQIVLWLPNRILN